MPLHAQPDQRPEDRRRGLGVAEGRVRRLQVELELGHQPDQRGCLPGWQLEKRPAERRRVDDRVLERPAQAPRDQPGVEGVVAVLDEDAALGELQKGQAGLAELGRAGEHAALDLVPLAGVGVDRRPGVDQGVEEGQGALEAEAFGADLEHQEGPVARGLDVERGVLSLVKGCVEDHRRQVHPVGGLPLDRLERPARLQLQ